MDGPCPTLFPGDEFLQQVLLTVDCHAQSIGAGGYQALAAPGSLVSLALTGLLTIFVALFGFRMLMGQAPDARDGILAVVKVGVVLALATSWPAFRTLAYDVAFQGPAELAATIGGSAGLPGAQGGLVARLQGVDNELAELMVIGTGRPPWQDQVVGPTQALTPDQQRLEMARLQQLQQRPPWDAAAEAKTVAQARALYLAGAIGAFASVRLIAGLLLALGPLFALFLLFDHTRGLFEGWVRGLAGAALGAFATAIMLGVQLALMEPWLANILTERRAGIPTPTAPIELLVMSLGFALALLAALIATAWVARGFRTPQALRIVQSRWSETLRNRAVQPAAAGSETRVEATDQRSRAFAVADAVAASQRREAIVPPPPPMRLGFQRIGEAAARDVAVAAPVPLGQSHRRRTRTRVSAGAQRRDGTP